MHLEIKGDTLNYNLKFNHKINILQGKGAIHKSFINKVLKNALTLPEFSVKCDKEVIFIDSPIPKDTLIGYDNYVMIIDESATLAGQKVALYNSEEFKSFIYKSDSVFVLIKRNKNIDIKYGSDQVYTFDKSIEKDGIITLLKYYDIDSLNRQNKFNLVSEDSGAGLKYFQDNNISIDPSFDIIYKQAQVNICDIGNSQCLEQQLSHCSFITDTK